MWSFYMYGRLVSRTLKIQINSLQLICGKDSDRSNYVNLLKDALQREILDKELLLTKELPL